MQRQRGGWRLRDRRGKEWRPGGARLPRGGRSRRRNWVKSSRQGILFCFSASQRTRKRVGCVQRRLEARDLSVEQGCGFWFFKSGCLEWVGETTTEGSVCRESIPFFNIKVFSRFRAPGPHCSGVGAEAHTSRGPYRLIERRV